MATLARFNLTPPVDLETGKVKFDAIHQNAMVTLAQRKLGLPAPPASGYAGQMPNNITALTDDQLGDLLNDINQYISYVEGQAALATVEYKIAADALDFVEARVRDAIKNDEVGRKLTNPEKADMATVDPRVFEARYSKLYFEDLKIMIDAILSKAQRDWDTVSRRITQRGQDIHRQVRVSNNGQIPTISNWQRR